MRIGAARMERIDLDVSPSVKTGIREMGYEPWWEEPDAPRWSLPTDGQYVIVSDLLAPCVGWSMNDFTVRYDLWWDPLVAMPVLAEAHLGVNDTEYDWRFITINELEALVAQAEGQAP